jgi:hypothetical protein
MSRSGLPGRFMARYGWMLELTLASRRKAGLREA